MSNPALRMIVRSIEDAEKLGYDVEAAVRVVVARRLPENRHLSLEALYEDKLIELRMERAGWIEVANSFGEAA